MGVPGGIWSLQNMKLSLRFYNSLHFKKYFPMFWLQGQIHSPKEKMCSTTPESHPLLLSRADSLMSRSCPSGARHEHKGPSIKDVPPDGGGGVNQKRTTPDGEGGGRQLNRTSASEDFEQIFCTPSLPRPRLSGSQNMLHFRAIRAGRPRMGGEWGLLNERCQTGGGVCPTSQFLPGRFWWMTPNASIYIVRTTTWKHETIF